MNAWRFLWRGVWNISEFFGVGLGGFGPWVFHQMIGCNKKVYRQIDDKRP